MGTGSGDSMDMMSLRDDGKEDKRQDHKGVMTIKVTQSDRKCGW